MKYLATISKLFLGLLLFFAFSNSAAIGQTILDEELRDGSLPTGWTEIDVDFRTAAGGYALFETDDSELWTSSFDLSTTTEATLTFQVAKFSTGDDGPLTVQVSLDGGATWDAQTYTSPVPTDANYLAAEMEFDESVLGEENVWVRFIRTDSPSAKRLRDVMVLGPDGVQLPDPVEVATLAELRNGEADGETRYRLTNEVLVHFRDGFRGRRMLVDATAGVWSVDLDGSFDGGNNIGDGVTGLVGTLNTVNNGGLLRFELDEGSADAEVTSTGNEIDPETITITDLSTDDTGKLVLIEGVTFQDEGEFGTGNNYALEDSEGNTLTFRTDYFGADYIGETIPQTTFDVVGVVGGFGSSAQIFARSSADFIFEDVFANLQIIHNSPDPAVSSVDIFVNEEEFLTDVDFRMATAFTSVPANVALDIKIAPAGAGIENAVGPITVTLEEGGNYIAVASGVLDPAEFKDAAAFSLELLAGAQTSAADSEKVDVVIHHGSPDAPAVDIYLRQIGGDAAIQSLDYPSFTDYVSLDPVNEVVGIAGAGGDVLLEFSAPFAALDAAGASVTVLASGFFEAENAGEENGFGLLAVLADGTVIQLEQFVDVGEIGWVNLQWPETLDLSSNEEGTVYAEVYAEGVTEGDEASEFISAWIGVHNEDTDPADWPESAWIDAEFNESKGNNDEYQANISRATPGTYYYASRFQISGDDPVYGGFQGGFWDGTDNVSGTLTVTPVEVQNLAELRMGGTGSTVYSLPNEVVLTFNSTFRGRKVVTDFSGGIVVDDPGDGVMETEYNRYDGITGLEGTLSSFNGLLQFTPTTDPGPASSSENSVFPLNTDISELDFEADLSPVTGQLVLLQDVTIQQADGSAMFENQTTYTIEDANGNILNLRTDRIAESILDQGEESYIGTVIPQEPVNIVGYMTQFNTIQIVPRTLGDFTPADAFGNFSLVAPGNDATVVVEGDHSEFITISWEVPETDLEDVTYNWIATDPLALFSIPTLNLSSAASELTLPQGAVDEILAEIGVEVGESITVKWTVVASGENALQYADEVWTVTLERGIVTSNEEVSGLLPKEFKLQQNYPNPFNPSTQIEYALPQAANVHVAVYNVVGQQVAVLVNNEQQTAGFHNVSFDASNLASGMYLYRIQAGNFVQTRKMTLIK